MISMSHKRFFAKSQICIRDQKCMPMKYIQNFELLKKTAFSVPKYMLLIQVNYYGILSEISIHKNLVTQEIYS